MADPRYLFKPVLYEAVTPLHVGAGQDVGIVDLPVVRERTTDYPYLPGSGIRGALRERAEAAEAAEAKELKVAVRLFGNDKEGEIDAGCVSVLDAHLLLFPVRSAPGIFCWSTCPFSIERLRSLADYFLEKAHGLALPTLPEKPPEEGCFLGGPEIEKLYLEEYPFERGEGEWSWPREGLAGAHADRVVLISDADYLHFVRTATIVRQRNRLTTAKTVLDGNLFSVEMVPAESWFYGFLGATAERVLPEEKKEKQEKTDEGEKDPAEEACAEEAAEEAGAEEAAEKADAPQERKPPFLAKDSETELRRLLIREGAQAHLVLGGHESVGLGITRMTWPGIAAGKGGEQ